MAYANRVSRQQRGPILVAIGALHAGVIYALVAGLSGFIQLPPTDEPLVADNIPITPMADPKPTEEARERPAPRPATSHSAQDLLPSPVDTNIKIDLGTMSDDINLGPVGPIELLPPPPPQPPAGPNFPPKAATPRGSSGLWVTSADYPASELRMGHEGVTRFTLSIGADGSVKGCTIVATSGHAGLDRATCANLTRRGKFKAATDDQGKAVAGSYSGSVRWKLPPNY